MTQRRWWVAAAAASVMASVLSGVEAANAEPDVRLAAGETG